MSHLRINLGEKEVHLSIATWTSTKYIFVIRQINTILFKVIIEITFQIFRTYLIDNNIKNYLQILI